MTTRSSQSSGRLRVTQAYISLLRIPGSCSSTAKTVSIARIGKYEIRMLNGVPARSGEGPLVWMELFDHDARTPADSCSCREIEDAVAAFDAFVLQANLSNEGQGRELDDA